MAEYSEIRKAIVDIGLALVRYGLTYASLGNISVRYGNYIFITPSGIRFDIMKPEDIVILNASGKVLSGNKPSVETPMHLEIYRRVKDASAIIHAHAPYATALGTVFGEINSETEDAKTFGLEKIPTCKYAPAGTLDLARNVAEVLVNSRGAVIPNHGVVVWGETLDLALKTVEAMENIARIEILKLFLGVVKRNFDSNVLTNQ